MITANKYKKRPVVKRREDYVRPTLSIVGIPNVVVCRSSHGQHIERHFPKEQLYFTNTYKVTGLTEKWELPRREKEQIITIARPRFGSFYTSSDKRQFLVLASKWKEETGGYSTSRHITGNANYIRIKKMGKKVLPFIFEDMQKEPNYWFDALNEITQVRVDPIPNEHYGDIYKMTEDWVDWGRKNRII